MRMRRRVHQTGSFVTLVHAAVSNEWNFYVTSYAAYLASYADYLASYVAYVTSYGAAEELASKKCL